MGVDLACDDCCFPVFVHWICCPPPICAQVNIEWCRWSSPAHQQQLAAQPVSHWQSALHSASSCHSVRTASSSCGWWLTVPALEYGCWRAQYCSAAAATATNMQHLGSQFCSAGQKSIRIPSSLIADGSLVSYRTLLVGTHRLVHWVAHWLVVLGTD